MAEKDCLDTTVTIPETGRILHIHGKTSKMKGCKVYVIYLSDVTRRDAEINALYELTNDIPHGVGIYNVYYDHHMELVFMNGHLYKMIGEERRRTLLKDGKSDLCLIHPDDQICMWEEIRTALREKRDVDVNLHMRVYDGEYQLLHLHGKLIKKDTEKSTFYCQFQTMDYNEDQER
ncbi:MAG: hypothetical protein Q4G60_03035 [bacterium]|nr:hypothetical protein [bacterium]